ncbi:putative ABC transporter permease [Lachnoanaerobaculum sp. Marseille-Q4761]|uniref:putative ABC transporter permease n=1 Tax=Lachnoanaerobaculum sp. Marseille-Q4761 TaxID=2819511 RepID=UPI001AA1B116|nr:putative ABC transporter permease [Lachnoanaerobaculum sp. Marseille-Q4761]MBO1871434.1 putative ABC transporter permease [Lachnoanaerobaculum sp. Marseille-Q4761]
MTGYTLVQWIAFFYIYCFLGWCFESGYATIKQRKLTNRGFLRGPYIPIYAFGAIFVLIITDNFQGSILSVYFSGLIAATVLEYITGYVMEKLFKVKYWDYSDHKFNLNGYISLSTSIAWGFLSVLLTEVLQVNVYRFVSMLTEHDLKISIAITSTVFFLDLILSIKAAFSIAKAYAALERAKLEFLEVKDKLSLIADELLNETQSKIIGIKDSVAERMSQANGYISTGKESLSALKSEIENVLSSLSNTVASKSPAYLELKRKYEVAGEKYTLTFPKMGKIMSFFIRNMIKGNPGLNKKYLSQLKELSEIRKRNNK